MSAEADGRPAESSGQKLAAEGISTPTATGQGKSGQAGAGTPDRKVNVER